MVSSNLSLILSVSMIHLVGAGISALAPLGLRSH